MRVSLGRSVRCGHVCRLFFGTPDMKLTSVMEGIMLKHYDKIDRDQHL